MMMHSQIHQSLQETTLQRYNPGTGQSGLPIFKRYLHISLWRRSYNPGTGQSGLPTFKRYLHISLWRRSYNPGAGQPGLPIFRY